MNEFDIPGLLKDSFILELNTTSSEEDIKKIMELNEIISSSGLYLFTTTEMIEVITSFISNSLAVRKFIYGVTERFFMKLACLAPNITQGSEYVNSFIIDFAGTIYDLRSKIQSKESIALPDLQATLNLESLIEILTNNPCLLVLYLGEATGAYTAAIATFSQE